MPVVVNEILKYIQGQKSIKTAFVIYTDTEKIYSCENSPEHLSTKK